ncbi:MAG: Imidazole glycerol phosphate synthase subunit HisH, partial [Parcubacteria group bacterium GW2011_GWA2_47_8]
MRIAIIDYNAGNIASVTNALERFGILYTVTRDAKEILSADKVIFPGQGRAKPAMEFLRNNGLVDAIRTIKKPFLGICLGMQLLFMSSEEDDTECLGIIPGTVRKFRGDMKIPQIGWNTITAVKYDPLLWGLPDTLFAYFANSYYAESAKPYIVAASSYGNTAFAAVIRKDNFYGTQFHPEKSSVLGVQILKNFCELGTGIPKTLLVAPAIDIIGGKCVRLLQGEYNRQTTYGDDPALMAKSFVDAGAKYLHVVDLD